MYNITNFGGFGGLPFHELTNTPGGGMFMRMRQPGEDFNPFWNPQQPQPQQPQIVNATPPEMAGQQPQTAIPPIVQNQQMPQQTASNNGLPSWLPQTFQNRAEQRGLFGQDQTNYMQPAQPAQFDITQLPPQLIAQLIQSQYGRMGGLSGAPINNQAERFF